ncbi:hypothetical protein, partial [uncultured Aquincola sp.]|uniref:hypothetical protein n=1 Tax=uncultured Aquincola sp. TaxID=886556 RepID=UPI0032B16ECC
MRSVPRSAVRDSSASPMGRRVVCTCTSAITPCQASHCCSVASRRWAMGVSSGMPPSFHHTPCTC